MSFERLFTKAMREQFLQRLRNGMQRGVACDAVFGKTSLTRREQLCAYIESHDEFRKRVEAAEQDATEHVKEALYWQALEGNVQAAKIWLELHGEALPEKRGRPPKPEPEQPEDPFADLDNVMPIRPR